MCILHFIIEQRVHIKGAASNWEAVNFYWPVCLYGNTNLIFSARQEWCTHTTGGSFNLWNFNLIRVLQALLLLTTFSKQAPHTLFNCFAPRDLYPCEQTCLRENNNCQSRWDGRFIRSSIDILVYNAPWMGKISLDCPAPNRWLMLLKLKTSYN